MSNAKLTMPLKIVHISICDKCGSFQYRPRDGCTDDHLIEFTEEILGQVENQFAY